MIAELQNVKKIEMPQLFEDINILLAQLVGWKNIELENSNVLVCQDGQTSQKFDFLDKNVIFPIADKYSKKATKVNAQWVCEYKTKDNKKMMVISENEQTALAMAIVLEYLN